MINYQDKPNMQFFKSMFSFKKMYVKTSIDTITFTREIDS